MRFFPLFSAVLVICALIILISTASDASVYADFSTAKTRVLNLDERPIHVIGTLTKDKEGHVIGIETSPLHLSASFLLLDNAGVSMRVYYGRPLPPDFERSDKVVVVGVYDTEKKGFAASKVLLKCPSKYTEEP